jgi:hypothetical protein
VTENATEHRRVRQVLRQVSDAEKEARISGQLMGGVETFGTLSSHSNEY